MKKPFFILSSFRDIAKLIFCIALSLAAGSLFFEDASVAVFTSNAEAPKSLFGLLSRMVQ